MALFSLALELVLKNEGGLEEATPSDPAGITNMGISLRFLKGVLNPSQYGIHDQPIDADTIRHLSSSQVAAVYKGEFWDHAPFERISDQDVASYIFDAAVAMGISPAVKCLQRAVWSVWQNNSLLPDDGIMGDNTLMWIERCKPIPLIAAMRSERSGEYRLVAESKPLERNELEGWLNRSYRS